MDTTKGTTTPIIYSNHGLANNFGDVIEVNKHLKDYPVLYNQILEHEFGHKPGGFTMYDLKHDFMSRLNIWELARFMIRHPLSFTQFLPFYISKKRGLVYDANLCIAWAFVLTAIIIGVVIVW